MKNRTKQLTKVLFDFKTEACILAVGLALVGVGLFTLAWVAKSGEELSPPAGAEVRR